MSRELIRAGFKKLQDDILKIYDDKLEILSDPVVQNNDTYYDIQGSTIIAYIHPLNLKLVDTRIGNQGTDGNQLYPYAKNYINAGYFYYSLGRIFPLGLMVYDGKEILKPNASGEKVLPFAPWEHSNKPRGMLTISKKGVVDCGRYTKAPYAIEDMHLCFTGFDISGLEPWQIDRAVIEQGQSKPSSITYQCNRCVLGYRKDINRIVVAMRPNSTAQRIAETAKNLLLDYRIIPDAGGSFNANYYEHYFETDRPIPNILTWI